MKLDSDEIYSLGVIARMAISYYGLNINEVRNCIHEMAVTLKLMDIKIKYSCTNFIQQFILHLIEKSGRKIDKLFVLIDESLDIYTMLNNEYIHQTIESALLDQKLNDNNGNAPIHYLIDKFIDSCKQDDLYKPSNKEIKSIF